MKLNNDDVSVLCNSSFRLKKRYGFCKKLNDISIAVSLKFDLFKSQKVFLPHISNHINFKIHIF